MKPQYRYGISAFVVIFLCLALFQEKAMAIEESPYTVIEEDGKFQLRQYAPQIVAETILEGTFDEVGNKGFRLLFDYISGNNTKKKKISMTAPVSQEPLSEKIPMTAPVNQEKIEGKWHISFFMPAQYTMENIPQPNDERVVLKTIPARMVAAVTYSGTWSRSRYEKRRVFLENMLAEKNLKPAGEYIFARYNPPFMPWFLRRNEVLLPVERIKE
jgi:hypothetical protein